ncbi:PE-PGRS family protein [Mycobacterium tuberculosis CPHL_A]|nr:PE-PGRS family protein [Mycobacterium tuberculosis CPHL_A]
MSLVIVAPETVAAAALDVARIGSSIGAANAAAAGSTTSVLAAGADEVSAAIATLFGSHAREYQAISTQVAAFHDRFAQTLSAAVGSYVSAEATNAHRWRTPGAQRAQCPQCAHPGVAGSAR